MKYNKHWNWKLVFEGLETVVAGITTGFVMALFLLLMMFASAGILFDYWDKHPNLPTKTFCESYLAP